MWKPKSQAVAMSSPHENKMEGSRNLIGRVLLLGFVACSADLVSMIQLRHILRTVLSQSRTLRVISIYTFLGAGEVIGPIVMTWRQVLLPTVDLSR